MLWNTAWTVAGYDLDEAAVYYLLGDEVTGLLVVELNLRGHYTLTPINPTVELPPPAHFSNTSNWIYHQDLARFQAGLIQHLGTLNLDLGRIKRYRYEVQGHVPLETPELVAWITGYQLCVNTRRTMEEEAEEPPPINARRYPTWEVGEDLIIVSL